MLVHRLFEFIFQLQIVNRFICETTTRSSSRLPYGMIVSW